MWDYIVRGALKLPRRKPSWLNRPQMMRLTITTDNVLRMLGGWEIARPYNFLLLPNVATRKTLSPGDGLLFAFHDY
jgi:hypothetical protein